jgi:hypothetical protein
MVEAKPKVEIKLEQTPGDGCSDPGCSPETCGSVVEPKAEQKTPVVAGASDEACCEPECGPGTCP